MQRVREKVADRCPLEDLSRVHHRHLVADARDDSEVVRDVEDRRAELGLELLDQIQDDSLRRDVECRGGLV